MRPEDAESVCIAGKLVRRQMGLPDLIIPINLDCLSRTVSGQPVATLSPAQASIEHEQLVGQLQALVALRDYLPLHIYHHAADHLFGKDELASATLMPEYTNLRAYTAGNIELCKSIFLELDRHLHEVLAPRLDELGLRRYSLAAWPGAPTQDVTAPAILSTPESCLHADKRRCTAQES